MYLYLTAFLASEIEFTTPCSGPGSSTKSSLRPFVLSPWPPVEAIVFPEVKILGPGTTPLLIAFLSEIFTPDPPTSRTVVKPAMRVFFAITEDLKATSALLS